MVDTYFPVAVSKFGLTIGTNQIQTQSYTVYEPTINQYNNTSYIDPNGIYKIQPDIGDPIYMLGTTAIDIVADENGNVIYQRNFVLNTSNSYACGVNNTNWFSCFSLYSFLGSLLASKTAEISFDLNMARTAQSSAATLHHTDSNYENFGAFNYVPGTQHIETSGTFPATLNQASVPGPKVILQSTLTTATGLESTAQATVSKLIISLGNTAANWVYAPEDIITVQSTTSEGVLA
ncbi:hypothetical protein R5P86_04585 [Oenococcus oeni]